MRRALSLASLAAVAVGALTPFALNDSVGASTSYTKQTLHFAVKTGPGGTQACDIIGDLYLPNDATPAHRVPALLMTNGFGGSKDDFTGFAPVFAGRDYAVLAYSGLGFGGSTCKITLDDPDWDGKAGSQIVSYLGGAPGIAYLDAAHTQAAPPLDVVVHDDRDHTHRKQQYDPRVGMVGGSYGGEIQFAIAGIDPRVDTLIPMITWNDLSYSLTPNNTDQTTGVSSGTAGVAKLGWASGFSAVGVADGAQTMQQDPSRMAPCPNFATWVCPALASAAATGFLQPTFINDLRHASVSSYMRNIRIPVLLGQGENDTLFNLNESLATYNALKAQGTPVKMIWHSWGHSGSTPVPGEWSWSSPNPSTQYETGRVAAWFDHYLKDDESASTGPDFAYFRPWVPYSGNAAPAFATSPTPSVGALTPMYLSGDKSLTTLRSAVVAGTQAFTTTAAGLPSGNGRMDALSDQTPVTKTAAQQPIQEAPGTSAVWSTPVLTKALNVAGMPTLRLQVSSPSTNVSQRTGPGGMLVLFVKLEDVDASGNAFLINDASAPVRVPDADAPFTVTIPALVHQFAPGHKLRLVVAGGSIDYRGSVTAHPVTIAGGVSQVLTLPLVAN